MSGKNSPHYRLSILFGLFFVVGGGALFGQWQPGPRVILVPHNYTTIQEAINHAHDGDMVAVYPGTYNENIDFCGKLIRVYSTDEYGPAVTIIQGDQTTSVVTFENNETNDSKLIGFTIRNGRSSSGGGGIYCDGASPTIKDNVIQDNVAEYSGGGGIYCRNASPIIKDNIIIENMAQVGDGGGVYCEDSNPEIGGNIIQGNESSSAGGGIYCYQSSPVIDDNTIISNLAYYGGGVSCNYASRPEITSNYIGTTEAEPHPDNGNRARFGGGVYCASSAPEIRGNLIYYNDTTHPHGVGEGAGLYINGNDEAVIAQVADNFVVQNGGSDTAKGGGVYIYFTHVLLMNNRIIGNATHGVVQGPPPQPPADGGGGVYVIGNYHNIVIRRNIIDSNEDNGVGVGGGVYVRGKNILMDGNAVRYNIVARAGGGIAYMEEAGSTNVYIENTLIADNVAGEGGGGILVVSGSPYFRNNTLTLNEAGEGGGMYLWSNSAPFVYNSIVYGNFGLDGVTPSEIEGTSVSETVEYCDVFGGYQGAGNINALPLYADGWYRLLDPVTGTNPCIDAGDSQYGPYHDWEGDDRPTGINTDMGWDEHV